MRVAEALRHGTAVLRAAGIDGPALDARLLLAHATGRTQAALLSDRDAAIDATAYQALLQRRAGREPIALILGRQGFWSLDLEVSPDTLIPRPDSETLIEAALAAGVQPRSVLDLGTGSGCLLLAALTMFPAARGLGIDRVPAAARLAARNAAALGLARRSAFACGDWADAIDASFDLVLCNPPYIPAAEIGALMPEVAAFEPRSALDGGPDGLCAYRAVLGVLPRLLAPDGLAVLELGAGQAAPVTALARGSGFQAATRRDLAGIERALVLRHAPPGQQSGQPANDASPRRPGGTTP